MSAINNTQIDNAKDIDIVIPMYNLIEYSDNYSKRSRSFSQYYRNEPSLTDAGAIQDFTNGNSNSKSFEYK